jgi:hypothetical protein
VIIKELETIDDEADDVGIHFVKTLDTSVAEEELRLTEFPQLVYYQGGLPSVYRGERTFCILSLIFEQFPSISWRANKSV